jgi:hypothetical protein
MGLKAFPGVRGWIQLLGYSRETLDVLVKIHRFISAAHGGDDSVHLSSVVQGREGEAEASESGEDTSDSSTPTGWASESVRVPSPRGQQRVRVHGAQRGLGLGLRHRFAWNKPRTAQHGDESHVAEVCRLGIVVKDVFYKGLAHRGIVAPASPRLPLLRPRGAN